MVCSAICDPRHDSRHVAAIGALSTGAAATAARAAIAEVNMPAKKPKPTPTRMVSFRIEERIKKLLDAAAKADRRTTTSLVNLILSDWLKERP